MTDQATFTLTLDSDLRDRFIAEAAATKQSPEDTLRDLMWNFVARQRASGSAYDAEIARAIREADDPKAEFVGNDEIENEWTRQRDVLMRRIASGTA